MSSGAQVSLGPGLGAGLDDLGCAALLVLALSGRDPDISLYTGTAHLSRCFAVAPRHGEPRLGFLTDMESSEAASTGLALLDPRALRAAELSKTWPTDASFLAEVVAGGLRACGVEPGRIAVAGTLGVATTLELAEHLRRQGWTLVPGGDLSRMSRKTKSAAQLEEARRVAAGTCTAFRRVAELLAEAREKDGRLWVGEHPLTVGRVRLTVARALAPFALDQPQGCLIAPGEEGALPHSAGTDERALRPRESLVVDLFPRGWLYADCTRTFCVGEPPAALARAHATVLEVLEKVKARAAAGNRTFTLQDSACGHFQAAGYPTLHTHPGGRRGYVHGLGHGVGFDLHEFPSFCRGTAAEGVLAEGDLFTLEPGLYDPEEGYGVRVENLYHLGPDGLENLTDLPESLDPREWD